MNRLRRPLVAALLAFLAGLLAVFHYPHLALPPSATVLAAGVTTILGLLWSSPWARSIAPLVLMGIAGMATATSEIEGIAADCRSAFRAGNRLELSVVLLSAHRPDGATTPLIPGRIDGDSTCDGSVRVRLPPTLPALSLGAQMHVAGDWVTFDRAAPRRLPSKPGSDGFVRVDSVMILNEKPQGLLALRARVDDRIGILFPDHQPVIEALVLGRKEYLDRTLRAQFTSAGLAHLLAISGMHVGLVASLLLIGGSLLRLPPDLRTWLTIGSVWLYLATIGAPASAIRAGVMLSLAMLARLIQRPAASEAGIAAAALGILVVDPLALLEPGFQLSFAGVLGILLLRGPVLTALAFGPAEGDRLRWLRDAVSVSIAAFLVTTPIALHHFGTFAPISILAGIPAVPLMSLALAGTVLALVLSPLPSLARLIADGAGLLLDLLVGLANRAASLPLSHFSLEAPPLSFWMLGLAVLIAYRTLMRRSQPWRRNGVALAGSVAALVALPAPILTSSSELEIHFLDVGQGDATAIRTPGGRWILIDAGPASERYDAGERRILPFLKLRRARTLDALIITHPDLDHLGGAPAIVQAIDVRHIFEPGVVFGRTPYLDLIEVAEARGVDWRVARAGRSLVVDDVHFDMLAPIPKMIDASEDANQISAVVRLRFRDFELLLTGDADADVEAELVRRFGAGLESDVLKLGHHGSATSSDAEFLDAVKPQLAVVSAGRSNRYGHPAPAVLRRVNDRGIAIARTDTEGTVTLFVTADGRSWRREGW